MNKYEVIHEYYNARGQECQETLDNNGKNYTLDEATNIVSNLTNNSGVETIMALIIKVE